MITISRQKLMIAGGILALVGFLIGTRYEQVFAAIAPAFGMKVDTSTLELADVQKTYRALKANYDGSLDSTALINGASRGMVAAAGDVHTVFMDKKEAEKFADDLNGDIGGGIGAEIGIRQDRPTVVSVLPNTPAAEAGIKAGDVFLAVNDANVSAQTVEEVVRSVRGDVGSSVKLVLRRGNDSKEFTVKRAKITSPSVTSEIRGKTGILTIQRFDDQTAQRARQAAERFKSEGVNRVVVDLRNNGGGQVTAAQGVMGLWVKDKLIMTEKRGDQVTDRVNSRGDDPLLGNTKTIVLVNGSSASASEIVAGALRDYGKATLLGEKTYGKGSVQQLINLPNGAQLKVTVARWYTPQDKNIDKSGVEPDKRVTMTFDDVNQGRDPQLEAALIQ